MHAYIQAHLQGYLYVCACVHAVAEGVRTNVITASCFGGCVLVYMRMQHATHTHTHTETDTHTHVVQASKRERERERERETERERERESAKFHYTIWTVRAT